MVLKFQRALNNSHVLITGNEVFSQIDMTKELKKLFAGGYKFYAECHIDNQGIVSIDKKL